ncbi:component of SufBCD complex [Fertoebacter nigrum]|uniref:Component of SufBCD complex n=1 Tax=Fertoeibacter niger TaxID=2656921 RepID=A0A8X8KMP4_9RHOB|nr:component of SufBCD complex [Fertoeibacter niger]NUB43185.1 component of SufBCD complex [Fertoeibacter niger]
MEWYETVFEFIDTRSFSNMWFWIALAVLWSTASHWVLGVPYDLILRAKRSGGRVQADMESMVRINADRMLYIVRRAGMWLVGLVAMLVSALFLLGFVYGQEFAQAVFCLMAPMTLVGGLTLRAAARVEALRPEGADMHRLLLHHRLTTQGIGMVAIFFTALWGMYQNLSVSAL